MNKEETRLAIGIAGAAILGLLSMFFGPDLIGIGNPYGDALLYGFIGAIHGFGLCYLIACLFTMGTRPADHPGEPPEPSEPSEVPPGPWEGLEQQTCQACGHIHWVRKEEP